MVQYCLKIWVFRRFVLPSVDPFLLIQMSILLREDLRDLGLRELMTVLPFEPLNELFLSRFVVRVVENLVNFYSLSVGKLLATLLRGPGDRGKASGMMCSLELAPRPIFGTSACRKVSHFLSCGCFS